MDLPGVREADAATEGNVAEVSGQEARSAATQRLPWPTVRCVDCNNLYEIPVVETPSEFLRPGSILAAGKCPKCGSPTFSNLPEDRSAATERERLWREHELLVRLAREHGRRASALSVQVQPVLRRIWEIDHGK